MHQRLQIIRQITRLKILPNKRTTIALLINHIHRKTMTHAHLLLLRKHTISRPYRGQLRLSPNQEVPVVLHIMLSGKLDRRRLIIAQPPTIQTVQIIIPQRREFY